MFCTKCGARIAEGSRFCANCGAPVTPIAPPEPEPVQRPCEPEPDPVQRPYEPEPEPVQRPYEPERQPGGGPKGKKPVVKPERPRKKRRARGWIIGIAVFLVLIVAALGVWRRDVVTNLVERTVSSPEDYYQNVERRNIRGYTGALADRKGLLAAYGNAVNPEETEAAFVEEELKISLYQDALSDELVDLIENALGGMDISWLKNVGLYVSGGTEDKLVGGELIVFLNDTDIIGANVVLDPDNDTMYAAVPDLSGKYMKIDPQTLAQAGGGVSSYITAEQMQSFMPDEEVLARILNRYSDVILKDLTKVEKGTEKITAGGVTQTLTVMEVKIDGKTALKLSKDVLSKARDDRDIEDLICAYFEAQGMDEKQVDEQFFAFLDKVDELLARLEKLTPEEIRTSILMNVYVDAAGKVRGRDITIRKDKEPVAKISYVLTTKLLDYGVKAGVTVIKGSTETDLSFSGDGKISLKKEITGSFDLRYREQLERDGKKEETVDLKLGKITLEAALDGSESSFEVGVNPSKDLMELAVQQLYGAPDPVKELVRGLSLRVDGKFSEKKVEFAYTVRADKKDLLSVGITGNQIKPYDISVPADAEDMQTWAQSVDLSKLSGIVEKLQKAGVPASLLESLQHYL